MGVATFAISSLMYGIYHWVRTWTVSVRSLTPKVDVLDLNVKILVFVLAEELPGFRAAWNRYAKLYNVSLIEEKDGNGTLPSTGPTDQDRFERHLSDELRQGRKA